VDDINKINQDYEKLAKNPNALYFCEYCRKEWRYRPIIATKTTRPCKNRSAGMDAAVLAVACGNLWRGET
jgi:hypothetical protein